MYYYIAMPGFGCSGGGGAGYAQNGDKGDDNARDVEGGAGGEIYGDSSLETLYLGSGGIYFVVIY